MRHVAFMLKHIDMRTYNDFVGRAALQGIKLPPKGDTTPTKEESKFTPEDDALVLKAFEQMKQRRKK